MRCYICNRALSEKEISLDDGLKTEPCGECLEIIYETAYPGGFDPLDDKFVLIDDPFLSSFDYSDLSLSPPTEESYDE